MQANNMATDDAVLCLSAVELSLIKNVLAFVIKEIDDFEFQTRLGVCKNEVSALIRLLNSTELEQHDWTGFQFSAENVAIVCSSFNEVINGLHIDAYTQSIGETRDYLRLLGGKFGLGS